MEKEEEEVEKEEEEVEKEMEEWRRRRWRSGREDGLKLMVEEENKGMWRDINQHHLRCLPLLSLTTFLSLTHLMPTPPLPHPPLLPPNQPVSTSKLRRS